MKYIVSSFADERIRWPDDACMHCGKGLEKANSTREHVPSKCLLVKPYPEELMTLVACRDCNARYSRDEEYLYALLSAVISGSADPNKQKTPKAAHMFRRQANLRERIERGKTEQETIFGHSDIIWAVELERVTRVIVKNARGHAVYELDQWMSKEPESVWVVPILSLSDEQYEAFEMVQPEVLVFSELGTRMFQRECYATEGLGHPKMSRSWLILQDDVYRYAVVDKGEGLLVRSVLHEYLATQVYWSYE